MSRNDIDWESVEIDYRAGILSLRQMAELHEVSHVAIKKKADREGWVRDLSAKIKSATEDKVNKALVTTEVNAVTKIAERQIIEANATMQRDVILAHRKDICRLQTVCESLTEELITQGMSKEDLAHVAELIATAQTQDGDKPEQSDVDSKMRSFMKLLNLGARVDTFKKLVESKKVLLALEREAFGIESKQPGEAQPPDTPIEDRVLSRLKAKIHERATR